MRAGLIMVAGAATLLAGGGLFADSAKLSLADNIRESGAETEFFPKLRAVLGDKVVFVADDGVNGEEPWVTDGTAAGTRMLKNIAFGRNGSRPAPDMVQRWAVSGTQLFFSATNDDHGTELWVTDGTEAGTRLVQDLTPTPGQNTFPQQMVPCGPGILFKSFATHSLQRALWFSDGTAGGTRLLEVNAKDGMMLDSLGETGVVFHLNAAEDAHVLRTVGAAGTSVTTVVELPGKVYQSLGAQNGTLSFLLRRASGELELWRTDGTLMGTGLVKLLATNFSGTASTARFARAGSRLFFLAVAGDSPATVRELWETDGTAAGTLRVQQTAHGVPSDAVMDEPVAWGDKLVVRYHPASTALYGGVWLYDPALGQGQVIYDGGSANQLVQRLACTGTRIFFATSASPSEPGAVWVSDGTPGSAIPAAPGMDLGGGIVWNPVRTSADPAQPAADFSSYLLLPKGEEIFLLASSAEAGAELWKTSGTSAGTVQITDTRLPDAGSAPQQLRLVNGQIYFSADDGVHGRELWCKDGPEAGARLVADVLPGAAGSNPTEMTELGGLVYFFAHDGTVARALWKTDGTAEGTVMVAPFRPLSNPGQSNPTGLTACGGRLFFSARRGSDSREKLYYHAPASSESGVVFPGDHPASPRAITVMDGWVYFVALANFTTENLFRFRADDPESTLQSVVSKPYQAFLNNQLCVRPPAPGAAVSPGKSVLYALDGKDLWRVGNDEVAVKVTTFPPSAQTGYLHLQGDRVIVYEQYGGLWYSDGTEAGTIKTPLTSVSQVLSLPGDRIYFQIFGSGGTSGVFCCRYDGSEKVLLAPSRNTYCIPMHQEGDTFFFARSDDYNLWTVWSTQGTAETTVRVSSLPLSLPAPIQNTPVYPAVFDSVYLGSSLFLSANSGHFGEELYSLNLGGHLEVKELEGETEAEIRELASGASLTFPLQAIGQQAPQRRVLLRNTGLQPLSDVLVSLPSGSDFEAGSTANGTLDPGETAVFTLSFTPKAGGQRQDTLQITATGSTAITHAVNLTGTALGLDEAPVLRGSPPPRLALVGQSLLLIPDILTSAPYTLASWKRDGVQVAPSISFPDQPTTFVFPSVQLSDAGVYTLTAVTAAGSVTTVPAPMGVITSAPEAVSVNEWGALTLTCLAKAPKGYLLNYEWRRNGDALTDTKILKGSRSAVLKISRAELTDAGAYDCLVTLATAAGPVMDGEVTVSRSAGLTNVAVNARPRVLAPAEPLSWMIGEAVSYQMTADVPATGFTAKGLPPGLKMSKTGLITGKPTRSLNSDAAGAFLPFQVTVTATNAVGAGPAQIVPMQVHAFVPAGGYDCLLDPIDGLTHGSHLKFTVTSTGAFSGQLLHGGKMFRFTSRQLDAAAIPGRHFQVNLSTQTMPLMLMLIAPETEGQACVATLTQGEEGVLGQLQADCRRHLFSSTLPATALAGAYTWSMMAPGHEESPAGAGFMTATVARTGIVNWKGRLADGTAVTGSNALSSFAGGGVDLPVHADLYKLKGALHGAAVLGLGETSVTLSGSFFWDKDALPEASKERNYKAGFARHEVAIEGSRYQAPAAGEYLFGIVRGDLNAQVDLDGGHTGVSQGIALSVKHTVSLSAPTLSNGLFLKSLSFSVKTGTFKGSVLLLHESDPKLNRTATFEGLILSHEKVGRGFMLLPELPGEGQPASAIKTTPLRSVTVMVSAM